MNWTITNQELSNCILLSCLHKPLKKDDDVETNIYNDPSDPSKLALHFGLMQNAQILELTHEDTRQAFNVAITLWPTFNAVAQEYLHSLITQPGIQLPPPINAVMSDEYCACAINTGARITLSQYATVDAAIELLPKELELLDFKAFINETMLLRSNFNQKLPWPLITANSSEEPTPGSTQEFFFSS